MRRGVGQCSSCDMEAVGSEEVWVEVLEMSYVSLRRRQGDKCPLLFFLFFPPDARQGTDKQMSANYKTSFFSDTSCLHVQICTPGCLRAFGIM